MSAAVLKEDTGLWAAHLVQKRRGRYHYSYQAADVEDGLGLVWLGVNMVVAGDRATASMLTEPHQR